MYLDNPDFSSLVLGLCPDNTQWPCVTLGRTKGTTLAALLYSPPSLLCFLLSHPEPLQRQYQYLRTNDILGQSPVAAAAALQAHASTQENGGRGSQRTESIAEEHANTTQTTTTILDRAHEQGSQVAASTMMLGEDNDAPSTDCGLD